MGVLRTNATKALGLLIAVLLCFCFCTAAPVLAVGNVQPAAKRAAEFKEAWHVPHAFAVQEESGISLYKPLHSEKLLAKLTLLVLKGLYPLSCIGNTLLPAAPVYNRVSLTDTILTTGP